MNNRIGQNSLYTLQCAGIQDCGMHFTHCNVRESRVGQNALYTLQGPVIEDNLGNLLYALHCTRSIYHHKSLQTPPPDFLNLRQNFHGAPVIVKSSSVERLPGIYLTWHDPLTHERPDKVVINLAKNTHSLIKTHLLIYVIICWLLLWLAVVLSSFG